MDLMDSPPRFSALTHAAAPVRGFGHQRHESRIQRRAQPFGVLDGWWIEGCIEGVTGWAIGDATGIPDGDARALYDKLEQVVLPLYFSDDHGGWIRVMKGAINKNASYFNSHRMMRRYVTEAYSRGDAAS